MSENTIFFIWGGYTSSTGGASIRMARIATMLANDYNLVIFTRGFKKENIFERSGNIKIIRIPPLFYEIKKFSGIEYYLKSIYNIFCVNIQIFVLYPFLFREVIKTRPCVIIKEATTWDIYKSDKLEKKVLLISKIKRIFPWNVISKLFGIPYAAYFTNLWHYKDNKNYIMSLLYDTNFIISVDKWIEEHLKNNYEIKNLSNAHFKYVPICTDVNKFKDLNRKFPESNTILFVGRLEYERGCDLLVRAFPKIVSFNNNVKLRIIGNGSDMENLASLARDLNIQESIEFWGNVPNNEIASAYNGVKIFINPMRVPGIGNVTIEAMASGIPVIKTKMPDIENDPIIEGYNGFSFEINNYNDLAEKIIILLNTNQETWEIMSNNARKIAQEFDIMTNKKLWINMLKEITNGESFKN